MSRDKMLGSTWTFFQATGTWTIRHLVTVVAFDPERGWRLVGSGFSPAWVSEPLWKKLVRQSVLVPR